MTCPACGSTSSDVLETRMPTKAILRRRRSCTTCSARFTTIERYISGTVDTTRSNGPPTTGSKELTTTGSKETATGSGLGGEGVGPVLALSVISSVSSGPSRQSGSVIAARARKSTPEASEAFNEFWEVYPRKVAKQAAIRAWVKQGCDALVPQIMATLAWQVPVFERRDPDHVPHPASWLNDARWTDVEPTATSSVPLKVQQSRDVWREVINERKANR